MHRVQPAVRVGPPSPSSIPTGRLCTHGMMAVGSVDSDCNACMFSFPWRRNVPASRRRMWSARLGTWQAWWPRLQRRRSTQRCWRGSRPRGERRGPADPRGRGGAAFTRLPRLPCLHALFLTAFVQHRPFPGGRPSTGREACMCFTPTEKPRGGVTVRCSDSMLREAGRAWAGV